MSRIGVKDYLREMCARAPEAWRIGSVVMSFVIWLIIMCFLLAGYTMTKYPAPIFLTGAGLVTLIDVLIIFQFRLWKSQKLKIAELEEQLSASIKFVRLIPARKNEIGYDLEIINQSVQNLTGCIVKIIRAEVLDGDKISPYWMPMTLATRTQLENLSEGTFDLRAGEVEQFSFVYRATMPSGWISLDFIKSGRTIENRFFHNVKDCIFHLAAYGSQVPSEARIRVSLKENKVIAELLENAD